MPNASGADPSAFERTAEEIAEEIARERAGQAKTTRPSSLNGQGTSLQRREFPVMAEEAFYGPAGQIVRAIEPHTESDPVFLLINLHEYVGNVIGRGPHCLVEGSPHYTNLFALFVGSTSKARKGTGDGRIRQALKGVDADWCKHRIHSCLSSGEGVIWEVRDRITKMVKDSKSGNKIEEIVDEGVADKRLLVVQSEFAAALQVMHREGSILSAVLRDAWDRGDLGTLTKNSPARATGAHISIVGHITEVELKYLLDRVSMANGFGNRFLIACVKRSKELPFGGNLSLEAINAISEQIAEVVRRARNISEVRWSNEGAEGWSTIYAELSKERPGLFGALTARAEAQVLRLALIHALWDGKRLIEMDHLRAALAVWSYCSASIKYIFGDSVGNPTADTILSALKNTGRAGLNRTDISGLFSRNANATPMSIALHHLEEMGLVTMTRTTPQGGGRPAEVWRYRELRVP